MTAQLSMFAGQDTRQPRTLGLDAPEPLAEPTTEGVPHKHKCRPDWDPDKLDSEGYHALAAKVRELADERAKGNGWTPPRRRINKRALAHDRKRKAAQKEARQ